ncbi:hypothetical protein [Roseovarius rhodophyticola]|uniref:Uncharacterized protein n=1 Tax=Roseovarius rhodophyticola TaxID=3080827 RepID=A0ABZ2TC52_9RHOB
MTSDSEILAIVRASPGRRVLGVSAMGVLGLLTVYVAMARPPDALVWQAFLLLIGGLSLWLADAMRRATALAVELTRDGLRTSDGEVIAPLDQIETLDRGIFAFKPSNGFLIKLKRKPRRDGSRGFGGVLASGLASEVSHRARNHGPWPISSQR